MGKCIILEGPDGSGKTTLAKHLSSKYAYEYVHCGPPKEKDMLLSYATQLYGALNHTEDDFIFDRLHIGEAIYGPILRNKDLLTHQGEILMNRLMKAREVILVFCLPPYDKAYENWKKRKKSELVQDHVQYEEIYSAYKARSLSAAYSWSVHYDYTIGTLDMASDILTEFSRSLNTLPHGVIGDPRCKYLFVGDIANQKYLDLPFFALSNSSLYLNDCLTKAKFKEEQIALTNARRLDGSMRNLRQIWETMNKPRVISLGDLAARLLKSQKVPHKEIPHPAFWKRFHVTQQAEYIQYLFAAKNH